MPQLIENITAIIINLKTLHLIKQAYETLCTAYTMPIVLIDNGSHDGSAEWVSAHGGIVNENNIGHGPALHQAVGHVATPYFLTLDSDCIINQGGFLELMLEGFANPTVYAVGWQRWTCRESGIPIDWYVPQPDDKTIFVPYAHPVMALFEKQKYTTLHPFNHHGAPLLANMLDAEKKGYTIHDFPIFDYITHLGAGTRRMYNGWWSPKDSDQPKPWRADDKFAA